MSIPPPTPQQARILWISLTALAIGVLIALIGLLTWGLGFVINKLSPVLLPLAIAGIIAYLLDPLVDFFEQKGVPRVRAILLVFFLAVMLLLGLLATVVPRAVIETERLVQNLPDYRDRLNEKVQGYLKNPPFGIVLPDWWADRPTTNAAVDTNLVMESSTTGETNTALTVESDSAGTNAVETVTGPRAPIWSSEWNMPVLDWAARALPSVGRWLLDKLSQAASWAALLVGLALVPIYTFYFLLEKKGITRSWTDYLPVQESRAKDEIIFVLSSINYYLILFFRGQVLVALFDGVALMVGFFLIGLDFWVLLGAIAGMLSIVPYLGVVLSLVPAVILAIIQFGTWYHPLLVVLIFIVVQTLEGLYVSPKIMGDRVGLHPLTIIVAVMVGTALMGGILGGILAIPLTAALRVLMFRYVWNRPGSAPLEMPPPPAPEKNPRPRRKMK